MFYSQFILAKKGPLGTIWIAAHLERKLRKNQVAETDIGVTVDSILFPEVPIALRLSGHLLLGVVRIYSRQVNYLFNDCSETLGKIKQAFHSAAVDLPPEATTAPFHTITLPETFDFDELELIPDSESSFLHKNGNFVDQHVTTREQITLQDTVDHNPYLGSSQFGLDERFDDGSYFALGLDFDEEFLADKVRSTPGASTSAAPTKEDMTGPPTGNESTCTPLLKEDDVVPLIECQNEVTPMDIDDRCEPVKLGAYEVDPLGEKNHATLDLGSPERDSRSNTLVQAISVDASNEHAEPHVALRKDHDFAQFKHDTPGFYPYTPRALEACTPDLNQEYCPPDEPSTPALVDETSLPMYKEFTAENAGRFSPTFLGHSERIAACETLPGPLAPHQVHKPWVSSTNETNRSSSGAPFQGFPLHEAASVNESTEAWPSLPENAQVSLAKENAAAVSSIKENAQISLVKENSAAMPAAFPSFPQQACLQQRMTGVLNEGFHFPSNAPGSLLTSSAASLPQFAGTSSSCVNNFLGGTSDLVVSAPLQHQGIAIGLHRPQSLFQVANEPLFVQLPSPLGPYCSQTSLHVATEPSVFQSPSTLSSYAMAGQGSATPLASLTCTNPPLFASSESHMPIQNVLPSGQMEHMDVDKNSAATRAPLWQPAAQQCNASSFAEKAPTMSPMGMDECEKLRSAYNSQSRSANLSFLQQGISDDRMPGLELDRNKFGSLSIEGATKEVLLSEVDNTPVLRVETPFTAARTSVLSTPSFTSVPGDDDVLASILGRRAKSFKVIPTPKEQKPLKASVVSKRPKVSRATPKRRKVELDPVVVLHGDVIRQQLANAEDIRRERRKAPCTRREVWGFLRECEGQENFDEPTLPELSSDLHDLYHDVLHGHESRPPPLSGATEVKEKEAYSELENAEDSDLLANYVKRISMKDARPSHVVGSIVSNLSNENNAQQLLSNEDVCLNQAAGNVENGSIEKCLEQPKEDREGERAAQRIVSEGSMEAGDAETSRAEEPSRGAEEPSNALDAELLSPEEPIKPKAGTEALDGMKVQALSMVPEVQVGEEACSLDGVRETTTEEQGAQATEVERELEVSGQVQDIGMEGVVGNEVVDGVSAVAVQHDTVDTGEPNQPSFALDTQAPDSWQIILPSEGATLQALAMPWGENDAKELPALQAADDGNGNIEKGQDKMPTSLVSEEETHVCENDEEMAAAELEGDTDCHDEDNDVAYAEIDYSSDEQDVSIQDDSGWSTRSRNVGKYLKTVFQEMETGSKRLDQGGILGLERLLARRTRREAARMFFETLVLKTKDYIHVEQNVAYQDILLSPNPKLMKTEF